MKQAKESTKGNGVHVLVDETAADGGHHIDGTAGQAEDGGRHTDGTADVLEASTTCLTIEDIRQQAGALGSAGKALDVLFMTPQQSSGQTPGGPMPTTINPTPVLPLNSPGYIAPSKDYGDPRTMV